MKIKHIVSIKTKLEEETSKHLVMINKDLIVFNFNNRNMIISIYEDSIYFFTGCNHGKEIIQKLINKKNCLGMYDYYINDKLSNISYMNLYLLNNNHRDTIDKLNHLTKGINKLIKS